MLLDFDDAILMEIGFYLMFFLSFIVLSYYIFGKRTVTLLFVLLGNVSFTLFFATVLFALSGPLNSVAPIVAFFDLTSIICYVIAIFVLFGFKIPIKFLGVISVANVALISIWQQYTNNFGIFRFITSLLIVATICNLVYKLRKSDVARTLPSFLYSLIVVIVFSIFKIFLSTYRLFTFVQGEIWFPKEISVNIMTLTSLCFVLWINFTIVFLTHDLLNREIHEFSYTDFLTTLPNRRRIDEQLAFYSEMKKRNLLSFAVVLLDVDDFKLINDKYGHDIGDEVLHDFGIVLSKSIRTIDFAGRWGGDEFVVLIQGQTKKDISKMTERLMNDIQNNKYSSHTLKVTISAGIIFVDESHECINCNELIALADERLYKAKRSGKNSIVF
jgi:diguanylate cyclase (GGDEF)-like protein